MCKLGLQKKLMSTTVCTDANILQRSSTGVCHYFQGHHVLHQQDQTGQSLECHTQTYSWCYENYTHQLQENGEKSRPRVPATLKNLSPLAFIEAMSAQPSLTVTFSLCLCLCLSVCLSLSLSLSLSLPPPPYPLFFANNTNVKGLIVLT